MQRIYCIQNTRKNPNTYVQPLPVLSCVNSTSWQFNWPSWVTQDVCLQDAVVANVANWNRVWLSPLLKVPIQNRARETLLFRVRVTCEMFRCRFMVLCVFLGVFFRAVGVFWVLEGGRSCIRVSLYGWRKREIWHVIEMRECVMCVMRGLRNCLVK